MLPVKERIMAKEVLFQTRLSKYEGDWRAGIGCRQGVVDGSRKRCGLAYKLCKRKYTCQSWNFE